MAVKVVTPDEAGKFAYVHSPGFINEPGEPAFLWVNHGTSQQLLINLAIFLNEDTAKIGSAATSGVQSVPDGSPPDGGQEVVGILVRDGKLEVKYEDGT